MEDLKLSEQGDLVLTSKIDDSGNVLRDLALVKNNDDVEQSIYVRIKTNIKEFALQKHIGNSIYNIIGKRNTKATAEEGIEYLYEAILTDNYITREQVKIDAIPTDLNTIVFVITVTSQFKEFIHFTIEMNVNNGEYRFI